MGLLFDPKMQKYLITWYLRVSKPSRRCQFMAGPASDDGVVKLRKRQRQVCGQTLQGWKEFHGRIRDLAFILPLKGTLI